MTTQLQVQPKPASNTQVTPQRTFQPVPMPDQEEGNKASQAVDLKDQVAKAASFGHNLSHLQVSAPAAPAQAKAANSQPIQRQEEEEEEAQAKAATEPVATAEPVQKSDQPVQFFIGMILPMIMPMIKDLLPQLLGGMLGGGGGGGGGGGAA